MDSPGIKPVLKRKKSKPQSKTGPTVYPSGVDAWVIAVLLISPIASVGFGLYLFAQGRADESSIMFGAGAFILLVTMLCILPCRYTVMDDCIKLRCGLIYFKRVHYRKVHSVFPSRTWKSGPALSMNRIEIETSKRNYVVSPKKRDRFLNDLRNRVEKWHYGSRSGD